jgi:2,4-dienoyl-CoA reductase-like NADH-dependent reductase (Old Yellow Enzyme family)
MTVLRCSRGFSSHSRSGLTLKNRLLVPPMVHYRAEAGSTCGTFHVVHLGRYALGGFGLVFVEATGVEEVGLINEHDLGIWNEAQVDSFRPLIAFMKRQGAHHWAHDLGINRRFEDWSPEYGWWLEKRIRTMEGFATPTGVVTRRA